MDITLLVIVGVFLTGLFALLGAWQRRIHQTEKDRVVAEIRDAKSRGSDKALTQHPIIQPELCIGCSSCVAACPEDGVLGLVDGIAHVIHGSRCIGHARCAEECPVGAITVGLGDISARPDIPIISENQETTIPGIYIAGELSGIGLIRHAIDQGSRAVAHIASKLPKQKESSAEIVDVLVVGSGPAGISATLKAMEQKLSYATIDQDDLGGTVRKYPRRKLTLTQTVNIPLYGKMPGNEYHKEELLELWEGIIKKFNVSIQSRIKLLNIQKKGDVFEAETSQGPFRSRAVVLALGRRGTPRKLGVPGEEQEKVVYQLIDASTYNAQKLLVVGGGDSAIEAAVALANQQGNVVTISYRKHDFFRLKAKNEERIRDYIKTKRIRPLFSSDVKEIAEKHVILSVQDAEKGNGEAKEGEASSEKLIRLANDYVFVLAGGEPPFPLLKQIGIGFGGSESPPDSNGRGKRSEKSSEQTSEKSSTKSPAKEACLA